MKTWHLLIETQVGDLNFKSEHSLPLNIDLKLNLKQKLLKNYERIQVAFIENSMKFQNKIDWKMFDFIYHLLSTLLIRSLQYIINYETQSRLPL